jgi:hypothetical protein
MAISDKELMEVLPVESRQKIDNTFEALTQALPTDNDKLILYRVAYACKLQPTDTVFSIMAALHYYLRLYEAVPLKIESVSQDVRNAGQSVVEMIGKATQEHLTLYKQALEQASNDVIKLTDAHIQAAAQSAAEAAKLDTKQHIKELINEALHPAMEGFINSVNTTIEGFKTEVKVTKEAVAETTVNLHREKTSLVDKVKNALSITLRERAWSFAICAASSFVGFGLFYLFLKIFNRTI